RDFFFCSSPRHMLPRPTFSFLFTPTPTPASYTLSLHDALPICSPHDQTGPARRLSRPDHDRLLRRRPPWPSVLRPLRSDKGRRTDRKSTRLNSSHQIISYAVFCLKKKTKTYGITVPDTV